MDNELKKILIYSLLVIVFSFCTFLIGAIFLVVCLLVVHCLFCFEGYKYFKRNNDKELGAKEKE
jgi:hypothetical protein